MKCSSKQEANLLYKYLKKDAPKFWLDIPIWVDILNGHVAFVEPEGWDIKQICVKVGGQIQRCKFKIMDYFVVANAMDNNPRLTRAGVECYYIPSKQWFCYCSLEKLILCEYIIIPHEHI